MTRNKLNILIKYTLVLICVIWFALENLCFYAVHYAKYTPHTEGVEPVLMEVIDSLSYIYQPNIEGIEYRFDGGPVLYNANNFYKYPSYFSNYHFSDDDKGYDFNEGDGESGLTYYFDERFTLIDVYDPEKKYPDLNSIDVALVKRKIYQAVQPVVDAQPEPFINLQWIYDLINRDRFNWE